MTSSTLLIDCVCMLHATTTLLPGSPSPTAVLMSGAIAGNSGVSCGVFGTLVWPARCASRTAPNTRSAPAATPAVLRTRFVTMNTYRVRGLSGRNGTISSRLPPLPAAVETRTV